MKRTFVCASCIKHYVQPSYGCRGTPVYVCLYCAKNIFHSLNLITKKYWNKKEKHFKNEQKVAMLQKANTRGVGISNMRKSICNKGAIVCV